MPLQRVRTSSREQEDASRGAAFCRSKPAPADCSPPFHSENGPGASASFWRPGSLIMPASEACKSRGTCETGDWPIEKVCPAYGKGRVLASVILPRGVRVPYHDVGICIQLVGFSRIADVPATVASQKRDGVG